ncbi:TrbG/VirB9 family P-type conjugative transfer protein [Caulobacter sp. NIBR2454]|uniref:TrbG/VirB9 family P-type conjugative transfer protein n=1 Tax=Caulobacter sp. NIBR2454 TaxID=3015996 RepID=UPI0022B5E6C1|nr:TrbG/VirB9 family P-type conjugative transfer protein [Caulobacter sp. NIBR2454]
MIRPALVLAVLFVSSTPVFAAVKPSPGMVDPRIRTVAYDPDEVVELSATLGYQLTIEFAADERIENVAVGDSLGWQVTPNRRANLLFLKPLDPNTRTNMSVITNLRRYNFALSARTAKAAGRDVVFGLRFDVPSPAPVFVEPPPAPQPPQAVNSAYSYSGSKLLVPTRVFDDGQATYFEFGPQAEYPAIFTIDEAKQEAVTNVSHRDGFLVVDELAPRFALRRGEEVTWIANGGYRPPATGGVLPQAKKGRP